VRSVPLCQVHRLVLALAQPVVALETLSATSSLPRPCFNACDARLAAKNRFVRLGNRQSHSEYSDISLTTPHLAHILRRCIIVVNHCDMFVRSTTFRTCVFADYFDAGVAPALDMSVSSALRYLGSKQGALRSSAPSLPFNPRSSIAITRVPHHRFLQDHRCREGGGRPQEGDCSRVCRR
jgi:hypothetical protein